MRKGKFVDPSTGLQLSAGDPEHCAGNGRSGAECCCDECDFQLDCLLTDCKQSKKKKPWTEADYDSHAIEVQNGQGYYDKDGHYQSFSLNPDSDFFV